MGRKHHCIHVIVDVQLDLTNVCVHLTLESGERACWDPLAGTVLAHNTCHGYYVFLNATGTASTRTSLNTSSEVTRHECFLYLYHVLKKSPATTVSYICLLTHWLLQFFHCLTCHTPFTFCSPCLILYDVAIIFMAEKYVHSEVHIHDTADKGLKYITILYGR